MASCSPIVASATSTRSGTARSRAWTFTRGRPRRLRRPTVRGSALAPRPAPDYLQVPMANYIRVDDGESYQLLPEIDPAELTVLLATALEGGDSVTVGIEPPL